MIRKALMLGVVVVLVGLGASQAVSGPKAPNTGPQATDSGPISFATLDAVVMADGTLVRGDGVVSSSKADCVVGCYEVIFRYNIRKCAYVATIGSSGFIGIEPTGEITVVGRVSSVKGVFLTTSDSSGNFADRGFHLAVHC